MDDTLEYGEEYAKINRAIFYTGFNQIIVFVEDSDKEYWYEIILKRLFEKLNFFIIDCRRKTKG